MSHFMFYAAKALESKLNGDENPVGESVQMGFNQETLDTIFAGHSAYSYEDLPSDRAGATFGANVFDPSSNKKLGEQIEDYLNKLGATNPGNAPNYGQLPKDDKAVREAGKPSVQNKSTTPIYTSPAPSTP